jgi:hypothetical protein
MDSSGLGGDEKSGATKWGKFAMSRIATNLVRQHFRGFETLLLMGILSHFCSRMLADIGIP